MFHDPMEEVSTKLVVEMLTEVGLDEEAINKVLVRLVKVVTTAYEVGYVDGGNDEKSKPFDLSSMGDVI
jgi:hypothetical protein